MNNCSPQKDGKNSCCLTQGDVANENRKVASSLAEGATHVAHRKNSRKIAFTEPSRGMSGVKVEQTSAETLSFRCVCERCRLMRGEVRKTTRKVAFTLAEVLITLGILGIVSALTLPSVIHKYRAEVLRTKFLQANTIVQDGVTQMRATDVDLNSVINNRDLPTLRKYIKGGDCRLPKNLEEANYLNYFETLPAIGAAATVLEQPYCMASGMTLWFVRLSEFNGDKIGESYWVRSDYSLLAVDINGWEQKPNVYGKDVFFWFYNGKNGTLSPTGEEFNVINTNKRLLYYSSCPGTYSAEAGAGCTSKALSEAAYFKNLKL